MTTLSRHQPVSDGAPAGLTGALLGGLAVASLAELLMLRIFTRTAIHIPNVPALQQPYEALAMAGRYAYFVSIALLVTILPFVLVLLWRTGTGLGRAAATAIGGFALVATAAAAEVGDRAILDAVTLASILILALSAACTRPSADGAALGLFGMAFLAAGLHTSLQTAGQWSLVVAGGDALLLGAELTGVGFAFASPLLARRKVTRGTIIAGVLATFVTFAFFQGGGGSSARILLLWNGGLQGALPAAVYAAAAGALAVTALHLYRARELTTLVGLALLIAGGIGLHNTYQTGLVVAGFAALHLAMAGTSSTAKGKPVT